MASLMVSRGEAPPPVGTTESDMLWEVGLIDMSYGRSLSVQLLRH